MDPLKVMRKAVPADVFNQVRLATLRGTVPYRVELVEHPGLSIIVCEDEWLAIDTLVGEQTIMAWWSFEISDRDNLHEPVYCELSLYHSHSSLEMGSVLDELMEILRVEED